MLRRGRYVMEPPDRQVLLAVQQIEKRHAVRVADSDLRLPVEVR